MSVDVEQVSRWVGARLQRVEDPPLLRGDGSYTDDLTLPGTLHAAVVRSPLAAARIRHIDTAPARDVAGVVDVLTATDLDGTGGLRAVLERPFFVATEMPLLAGDVVRHAGEPVAVVLADSPYAAEDGAEAVVVDYAPTTPVASIDAALADDAPLVHDTASGNLLIDVLFRDDPAIDGVLQGAAVVIDAEFASARVSAAPLEPRACLAWWDATTDRLTLRTSTQMPHLVRSTVADVLGLPEQQVRVVAPDVGGGFGQKCVVAREEVLIAALAQRLRLPVKWIEDRQENLTAAFSGHEQRYRVRAGFDGDGRLLALDTDVDCDVGAYSCYPMSCGVEPLMAAGELPGCYRLSHYRVRARAVATNKPAMAPYRGVSRPQQVLVLERLMDKAARRLRLDPAEVRRRNLVAPGEFPYVSPTGVVLDEGSYLAALDRCLEELDWPTWRRRQEDARRAGRLIGLGLSCFGERTGYGTSVFAARGMRVTPGFENADIRMDPTGGVVVSLGTSGHGQGHRTTLAQVVADQLGVDIAHVQVVEGDTDRTPYGWGTFASRTAVIGGGAARRAATDLAGKLQRIAGHLLEARAEDLELTSGVARVKGSPEAAVEVRELARIAHHAAHLLPPGEDPGLAASAGFDPPGTFSNATHGAEVEVDPSTGAVRILRYVVVEDCGVMLNPLVVDGQVLGGVAQGIAAALYERLVFDDAGQCRTASFIDYLVPTAAEIPRVEIVHLQTPCATSETGAKGLGEGGTIGAPAAIANAVTDAVAHLGVECDRLPILPDDLLAALHAAEGSAER
jgi:aerobic carbon-monoxide dehydrogenase large subunit